MTPEMTPAQRVPPRGLTAHRLSGFARSGLTGLLKEAMLRDAVDLALGTPGTPTPPVMIEAAQAALVAGKNQYEILDGNVELRRWIASTLKAPTDPLTELTITVGATEALAVALLSTVDPGDEVIVCEPFYENFISAIALAGGVPRFVPVHPPEWRWDREALEAAFGPKTRAVVLNSPNNPTGRVLNRSELTEVAALCERWDATLISDEVYASYVYDGREHVSAAELPGVRSVVIGSLSKSHAVSGWRLGYMRAGAELSEVLRRVHIVITGGTAAPLQEAAARAAALEPGIASPEDDLHAQRDRAVAIFEALGADCLAPEGGCYLMVDIRPITREDGETFAYQLLDQTGVLVSPGRFFYADEGAGSEFVRVAFNRPLALLDDADRRLTRLRASVAG